LFEKSRPVCLVLVDAGRAENMESEKLIQLAQGANVGGFAVAGNAKVLIDVFA